MNGLVQALKRAHGQAPRGWFIIVAALGAWAGVYLLMQGVRFAVKGVACLTGVC